MARLAPRASVLCIASIAAMAPWPLLGLALLHTQLDRPTEAFMFFGGVTMFPLIILMVFGSPPEEALMAIVTVVWLAAAVLPDLLLHKRLASWAAIGGLLGAQSLFSLAQAVMAGLLVIGKSV